MLKKKEQLLLFDKILRLSDAGLKQKHIAQQLSKFGHAKEKTVGQACLRAISQGHGFSRGLEPYVSANAYLCLLSGENVGEFQLGITDAINSLNVDEASTTEIAKALVKPTLGLSVLLTVCALLGAFAFPALAEQAPRQLWGGFTTSAETFCLFWLNYGATIATLLTGTIVVMAFSLPRYTGDGRAQLDQLPVYRQYRFIQCTNILTSVAHQTAVGMALKPALEHYEKHATTYLKHHIRKMLRTIQTGKSNIGRIFDTGLLDAEELDNLILLSDTGNASVILKKSANMHSRRLLIEIDRLKTWGNRILNTALYSIGIWMALGLGTIAFKLATHIQL